MHDDPQDEVDRWLYGEKQVAPKPCLVCGSPMRLVRDGEGWCLACTYCTIRTRPVLPKLYEKEVGCQNRAVREWNGLHDRNGCT